ncbi:MAG TPA: galactosyltransferase-related protein [Polyangiaceae bacterium]|nr:galactosyltransferase-related protein [Polyangiaceae bacterium]
MVAVDGYDYAPDANGGPYNKSRALNLAFKHFVTGPEFFAFDLDIVVPPDFLSSIVRAYAAHGAFAAPRLLYMPPTVQSYRDFAELETTPPIQQWWGAACLYGSEAFDRVNGFDEDYFGWGNEDDDLHARLAITAGRPGRTNAIRCFHQYHPRLGPGHAWFSVRRRQANEGRFRQRARRYASGELGVDEVNGLRPLSLRA